MTTKHPEPPKIETNFTEIYNEKSKSKSEEYQPGYINHFQCKLCHKIFTRSGNLKRHELTHFGEKSWECAYCDYKFFRKEHLIIHERKHTGEKPYVCDLCTHAFSRRDHLKAHILTHKSYDCGNCLLSFLSKIELKQHYKSCWKDEAINLEDSD